jgi:enoyl-CoA hydratase
MAAENITCHKKEHVAFISINTILEGHMEISYLSDELRDICSIIRSDNEVRVAVVTSSLENAFSLGENVISDVSGAEEEAGIQSCTLADPIAEINKPVIAGINGNAVGLGLELVLACDIRISTEKSFFGLPHMKAGTIPGDGGIQRLSRLVGKGKALEMILTGDMIEAHEANRIGLVNRIVSPLELNGAVSDLAHKMAAKSPIALKYAKEAVHDGMDLTLEQGLRLEADLYFLLHTTEDRREGIKAFQGKRSPNFRGK